jgi:hypothetical protein
MPAPPASVKERFVRKDFSWMRARHYRRFSIWEKERNLAAFGGVHQLVNDAWASVSRVCLRKIPSTDGRILAIH